MIFCSFILNKWKLLLCQGTKALLWKLLHVVWIHSFNEINSPSQWPHVVVSTQIGIVLHICLLTWNYLCYKLVTGKYVSADGTSYGKQNLVGQLFSDCGSIGAGHKK